MIGIKPILLKRFAVYGGAALGFALLASASPLTFIGDTKDALIVSACVFTGIAPLLMLPVFLVMLEMNLRYARSAVSDAGVRCHGCGYRVPSHPGVHHCPECGRAGSANELAAGWADQTPTR